MKFSILLISICSALASVLVSGEAEDINLVTLTGTEVEQSDVCGRKRAQYKFAAERAIDGKKKTFSYTCKKKRKANFSEWFKLKLANDSALMKQIHIIPAKRKKSNIINSTLTIHDKDGKVVYSAPIDPAKKTKRGKKILVDFGIGIVGHQITIQRNASRKKTKMRLAEIAVIGNVPNLPPYFQVPAAQFCPPGTAITKKENCLFAGLEAGGDIEQYKEMREDTWYRQPPGCFIGTGFYNDIGWNYSKRTKVYPLYDKFASVCTNLKQ
jgi:hypothetical protein